MVSTSAKLVTGRGCMGIAGQVYTQAAEEHVVSVS